MRSPDIFQELLLPKDVCERKKRAVLIAAFCGSISDGALPADTKLPSIPRTEGSG